MAPTTEVDQIAFLKCCFKHMDTKSGDIPMKEVVDEFGLSSIGAAKKRFERLMKGETGKKNDTGDTKTKAKAEPKPKTTKKRKIEDGDGDGSGEVQEHAI